MIDLFKDQILFIIAVADEIFDDLQSSVKGETDIFFWIKSALIDISACASHGLCNDSGLNKLMVTAKFLMDQLTHVIEIREIVFDDGRAEIHL